MLYTLTFSKTINAKLICEAANTTTTPEADKDISKKRKHLTPDILINAGGVTVSRRKWVQRTCSGYYWSEADVESWKKKKL